MALTQQWLDKTVKEHIDALVRALNKANDTKCIGVAVELYYPDGNLFSFYSAGYANGHRAPVTEDTVFAIGSITKTFTATALAYASLLPSNADKFSYTSDAPQFCMGTYLPPYLGPDHKLGDYMQRVSLRMLAQQMSGLPDHVEYSDWGDNLFQLDPPSPPPTLTSFWETFPVYAGPAPNMCWQYSDIGFVTLGYALLSGVWRGVSNYSTMLELITEPLQMSSTVTNYTGGATVAEGHPNRLLPVSANDAPDLKSSAKDILTWMQATLQPQTLSLASPLPQALAAAIVPYPLNTTTCGKDRPVANMGLAWQVEQLSPTAGAPLIVLKNGLTETGGCSSWIGMIPQAQQVPIPMGIAILANGYNTAGTNDIVADTYGLELLRAIYEQALLPD